MWGIIQAGMTIIFQLIGLTLYPIHIRSHRGPASRVPSPEARVGTNKKNGNQSPIVENEKLFCLVSCFQRPEARSPDCDPSVPPDRSIATDFIDKINCSKFGCSMFHLMRWSQLISYLGNRFRSLDTGSYYHEGIFSSNVPIYRWSCVNARIMKRL